MINTAKNKSDKAIIALLWDIGTRIGEIGNLRVKHIKFDDLGGVIIVNGKTGPRRVRAVWSVDSEPIPKHYLIRYCHQYYNSISALYQFLIGSLSYKMI